MVQTTCQRHEEITRRVLSTKPELFFIPIEVFPTGTGILEDKHDCALCEVCSAARECLEVEREVVAARRASTATVAHVANLRARHAALEAIVKEYAAAGLGCGPPAKHG